MKAGKDAITVAFTYTGKGSFLFHLSKVVAAKAVFAKIILASSGIFTKNLAPVQPAP